MSLAESWIWGISDSVARERLEVEGPNELPTAKKRHFLVLLYEVVREPMVSLIVGCGIIYLFLGDMREAISLLAFLAIIIFITIYQERKTENALESLRNLSSPRALVIRDGQKKRIPSREVVREDFLLLSEGDRVSADSNFRNGN
jgi:Ca2+-transporting ATPase